MNLTQPFFRGAAWIHHRSGRVWRIYQRFAHWIYVEMFEDHDPLQGFFLFRPLVLWTWGLSGFPIGIYLVYWRRRRRDMCSSDSFDMHVRTDNYRPRMLRNKMQWWLYQHWRDARRSMGIKTHDHPKDTWA